MAQFAIDEVLTTGIQISGFIFDYSSSLGTPGQVLASTSSGVMWQADSSIVDLSSLSGQIAATGTLLNNRINSLSGYSDATFATITNLATTGSVLDTKINALSGYSNQTFLSGVGVANYVPRWSGTKQLVTGNIYDDGTNVGIGTTIPGALLDVNGLFRFQQDIRVNNGTNKLILSATSTTTELHSAGAIGTIFKGAGNNEIARFDAANFNVGIGTATVSRKLHVYVDTGPVMRLQSSGSNASIEFIPSTIQNRYNWLIGAQQNISDAFEITPSTATNGTTFSNPAILVKSDGNVGIGTVSPSTLLSVGGAGSASAASGLTFGGDSQANLYRISSSRIKTDGNFTIDGQGGGATSLVLNRSSTSSENGMAFNTAGSTDWYFYVDNGNNNLQIQRSSEIDTTPRVRFDGSNSNILFNLGGGNVGIGVTNPSEKLTITGAVKILTRGGDNFKVGDGSNNNTFLEFDYPDISTADANFRLFRNTNTNGGKYFRIFKGDGTATSQTLLNANGDSHINAVAGNLGIGTDSPTQKLQVSGTVKIQSLGVYSDPTDNAAFLNYDTNGGIFTLSARSDGGNTYMAFRTSNGGTGSEKVRITNNGNVIIGNTTAYAGLTISDVAANDGNDSLAFFYRGTAGAHESLIRFYDFRGQNNASIGNNLQDDGVGIQKADLVFKTAYNSSPIERMRIDNLGNVGIGTTNPAVKLVVYDSSPTIRLQDSNTNVVGGVFGTINWLSSDSSMPGGLAAKIDVLDDSATYGDRGALRFFTNNATSLGERIRIASDGNVGIGTVSPTTLLSVGGAGSTSAASGLTFGGDASANLYRISDSRIKTDGSLEAAVGIISPTITSLSGNIAATGSTLDTKINTTNTNLAATGSTLNARINSLSGYAGSTFLSGQGVANWTARWSGTKELITGSIYDLGTGVGIGTSSPGARLDIAGTTNFQSDTFSLGVDYHYNKSFAYFYGRTGSENKGTILFNNGSASNLVFGEIASNIYSIGPGNSGAPPTSETLTLDNLNTRVGVGLASPQKELDVISSENDFVTVGARTLSVGGWAGVHFGYREDNNSYRKSAIIFERTDLTSSNAQGKVHILNGPQAGGGNATLADAKFTIDEGGKVGIGTTNPIYKLDITGPATSNGVTLRLNDVASVADSRHILLTRASAQASIGVAGSQTNDPLWISRSSGYDLMIDLNGRVGLGIVNPATLLGVGGAGSTTAASGITFGDDAIANLYRAGSSAIRTDGALIAGSYLRALSYVQFLTNLYPDSYGDNVNINIGNTAGNSWETAIKIKPGSYVGIGTTQPTGKLHVVSSIPSETVLKIDGTNGNLFSVVDDLSDSLMSVNNSAGLPVLEVFADDRIVAGQYGSGDFVLINNKVGIGTSNPVNKLSVIGAASIGSSTYNTSAPSNGLIVQGNVGIGTTNPSFKLHTAGAGFIGRQNSYGSYDAADADLIISNYNSDNTSILLFNSAGAYNSSLINYYNNILSLGLNNDNSSNLILTSTSINITAAGVGVGLTTPAAILNVKTSTTANREVFMGDSNAVDGVFRARLDDNSLSFISLENRDTAAAINHGVGIRFNLGTNASSNAINAGGIYLGKEQTWTATASTQDSYLIFNTSLDGSASEKVRITSTGKVGIGINAPTTLLSVGPVGSTLPASGLTFGGDAEANLYRSAEDTIKTDGNLVVAGTTSLNGHTYGKKTVTLTTASYTTVLTVNLTAHTSCYVKIGAFGDWGSHSAVAFASELFIQNGDNGGYAEPGTIITAHDNTAGTAGDKIDIQIVDPAAAGTQDFLIQLKLISATPLFNFSSLITYHVMGQQASVT